MSMFKFGDVVMCREYNDEYKGVVVGVSDDGETLDVYREGYQTVESVFHERVRPVRKIVQISTVCDTNSTPTLHVTALCDDGTVWLYQEYDDDEGVWAQFPELL